MSQSKNPQTPTLRDLFAMSALQGLLASDNVGFTIEYTAQNAYEYADVMLKVRKQGSKSA